jgi:hypothetical protein
MSPRSRTTLGLTLLLLAAFGVRGAAVVVLRAYEKPFTYEHGPIARNLLGGKGFTVKFLGVRGPTSQQAPLYPAMLAGAFWMWGIKTPAAFLALQLAQCLAGAITAGLVAGLGWQLLPGRRSAGWIAGWLAAIHPTQVYAVTHIQVVVWATLFLVLLLYAVVAGRWRGTWRGAVWAGALIGITLLLEPILALAAPVAAVTFWLHDAVRGGDGGERRPWRWQLVPLARVVVMAGVAWAVIGPWLWRNYRVHGEFVFIKSTFGYAFWQANNPHSWGTDKIPSPKADKLRNKHDNRLPAQHKAYWKARHETLYIDDVLLKPGGYREFAGLTEPQRSRLLLARARQFVASHPDQYARLCLNRLCYFLWIDRTNPKAAHPVYQWATSLWLAGCAAGLITGWRHWKALWPTLALFAAITLFHTLTITSVRFRLPIEPFSLVWIGLAIDSAVRCLITRRQRHNVVNHDPSDPPPHPCEWGANQGLETGIFERDQRRRLCRGNLIRPPAAAGSPGEPANGRRG